MDYDQLLEIECPFCSETQPSETAQWDENDIGFTTICQSCGKAFSGMVLTPVHIDDSPHADTASAYLQTR